jgi:hypothetical protein
MYSTEEKNELLQHLDRSRYGLMAALAGLSEAQSDFKPSPEDWSIANIVEHLAIVEDLVILRVQQLASSPDVEGFKDSDAVLLGKIIDRSVKFKAPERAQPTGKALVNSLERLEVTREKIVDLVQSAPFDIREHSTPHPVLGLLDGHQWLVALSGHCARHTQQIIETKAAPNFPEMSQEIRNAVHVFDLLAGNG